jgi:hypothetical protein
MISAMTALITNWDKILKILPQDHPGPVSQMIEKAKHPKSPKKIYRYRVVPASTPGETENPVSPP